MVRNQKPCKEHGQKRITAFHRMLRLCCGSFRPVSYQRYLIFLLPVTLVSFVTGCGLIQPTRADFNAATKTFLSSAYTMEVSLSSDDGCLFYETTATVEGENFTFDGTGTIYIGDLEFTQGCQTAVYDGATYKAYRGEWIPKTQESPGEVVAQVLSAATEKSSRYDEREISGMGLDERMYAVRAKCSLDWMALCDLDFDPFLMESPLQECRTEATCYFGADSHILRLVQLASADSGISAEIKLKPGADAGLVISEQPQPENSVTLSEDWTLSGDASPLPFREPEASVLEELKQADTLSISLQDTILSAPFTVDDLCRCGFTVPGSTIDPGKDAVITLSAIGSTDTLEVHCQNTGTETVSIGDCTVSDLFLFVEDLSHTAVGLPGGLTLGSTYSDFEKIWDSQENLTFSLPSGGSANVYAIDESVYGVTLTFSDASHPRKN